MNARTYYRRFKPTREQWQSLNDAGREYVRRINTPVYASPIPHPRSLVVRLLALHYPQLAAEIIRSTRWVGIEGSGIAQLALARGLKESNAE